MSEQSSRERKARTEPTPKNGDGILPIQILAKMLRQGPNEEEHAAHVWATWDSLSEKEKKDVIEMANNAKKKKIKAKEQSIVKLTAPNKQMMSDEQEEDDFFEVPAEVQQFVSDFYDIVADVNPQLRPSQVNLALTQMATQEGAWLNIIRQFPEAQMERDKVWKQGRYS